MVRIKPFARVYTLALLAKDGVWTEVTGNTLTIHTMEAYLVRKHTREAHSSWHAIIWKHAPSGKCIVGWTATGDNDPVVKTFPDEATARAAAALSL